MIRAVLILCLAWIGTPLLSQTVRTQTGEHATFTRVVLTIPTGAEWKIGRVPVGYGIQIEGADGFNLTNFFEMIPRDRISAAEVTEDGSLVLTVPCDCHVTANLGPATILVMDFADGPPPEESEFEIALHPVVEPVTPPEMIADAAAPEELVTVLEDPPVDLPELDLNFLTELPLQSPLRRDDPFPSPVELQQRTEERQRVSSLEVAVAESLSRAASQGLLELSDALQVNVSRPQDDPIEDTVPQDHDMPQGPERGEIRPGIVASTSVDSGLSNVFTAQNIAAELMTCWPDALVDVPSWGTDDPFGDQLALHRSAITGEFDIVDPDAVEDLARLYVYFGFGREAIQTLTIDGNNSRGRSALRSLAQIIDGDPVDDNGLLSQIACPGPVALWAVLASDESHSLAGVDQQSIARRFKQLPGGLQIHLGPRLATRIVSLSDPDTAENVLIRSSEAESTTIETAMAESEIARERGDLKTATTTLSELTSTEIRLTPDAVIELINLQIEQDVPISPETLAQAEDLKFEFRGSPTAEGLSEAMIRAHLHSGAHEMAFEMLHQERPHLSSETYDTLNESIVADVAVDADDVTFLDIAFDAELGTLTPETENVAASRLLRLGFPDRALGLIGGATNTIAMTERRYLRAEAAIALDDFALAQSHLAGIDTERATKILSFGFDGIPLASLSASLDADLPEGAVDAWRNGSWDDLSEGDDPLLRDVSAMVLNQNGPQIDPSAPLAGGRALVADASEARETLGALMNRFDAPLLDDLQ